MDAVNPEIISDCIEFEVPESIDETGIVLSPCPPKVVARKEGEVPTPWTMWECYGTINTGLTKDRQTKCYF